MNEIQGLSAIGFRTWLAVAKDDIKLLPGQIGNDDL